MKKEILLLNYHQIKMFEKYPQLIFVHIKRVEEFSLCKLHQSHGGVTISDDKGVTKNYFFAQNKRDNSNNNNNNNNNNSNNINNNISNNDNKNYNNNNHK